MSDSTVLVRQEHSHGCGIAVLAMLTGRPYADVYDELLTYAGRGDWISEERVTSSGLHQGVIEWYLAKHGYVWRTVFFGWQLDPWPPEPFAPGHVASVVQPSGNTHFVFMDKDGTVLDPMNDDPRKLSDWEKVNNVTGIWPESTAGS